MFTTTARGIALVATTLILQASLAVVAPTPAQASQLDVVFDPGGPDSVDPCTDGNFVNSSGQIVSGPFPACGHTSDLSAIVEATAAYYADVLGDDHQVLIRYQWLSPFRLPDAKVLDRDGDGRPTESRIRIPVDIDYFYDSTPAADEEFALRPKLYRTTHPFEQQEAFEGEVPEVLEVGLNGQGNVSGLDLVTIVAHEVGHALGLAPSAGAIPNGSCDNEADPFYRPDPMLSGGDAFAVRAFRASDGDFDCGHLDVGGITACKTDPAQSATSGDPSTVPGLTVAACTSHQALMWASLYPGRTRPSVVDLLALGEAGGWEEVDLPRKYSARSGAWGSASTWIGARAPGRDDDVYVVNGAPAAVVSTGGNRTATDTYVSDGSTLRVTRGTLDLSGTLTAAGPASTTGPLRKVSEPGDPGDDLAAPVPATAIEVLGSGRVEARAVDIEAHGLLDVAEGATVEAGEVTNAGVLTGAGTVRSADFTNPGRVRAGDGTLTIATPGDLGSIVFEPPSLDLDGPEAVSPQVASIQAVDGDLVVSGPVSDPVRAAILVGSGRSITFTHGWTLSGSPQGQHRLVLDGGVTGADVVGDATVFGVIEVNGLGRLDGNADFLASARTEVTLGATSPGGGYDQLDVEGTADLSGTLEVELAPGYQPQLGDSFAVVTYGGHTGEFNELVLPDLEGARTFEVHYGASELQLIVIPDLDVDGDGEVDIQDLLDLLGSTGPCPPGPAECPGDLNGNGVVDAFDILVFLDGFEP